VDLGGECVVEFGRSADEGITMSLAELKREVAGLSPAEQAELVAYIDDQLQADDPAYRRELGRLLDDQDRRNWVRWNDAKRDTAR